MLVKMSTHEGKPGQTVHVEVVTESAAEVARVQASVDAGLSFTLNKTGSAWTADTPIPYEAYAGTYRITFRAYDSKWTALETSEQTFKVI